MDSPPPPPGLLEILSISLILQQTAPHLPPTALLNLAATSGTLHHLVYSSPEAWRYLNLTATGLRSAVLDSSPIDIGGVAWRAERMDEALTEDEFYAGPLRGVFARLQRGHVLAFQRHGDVPVFAVAVGVILMPDEV